MNHSDLLTYVVVFLVVFVPYLFLQFCLDNQGKKKEDRSLDELPLAFRWCFGLLNQLSDVGGRQLAAFQEERAKDIRNKLVIANLPMKAEHVFAAEALFGIVGTVVPLLFFALVTKRMDYAIGAGLLFGVVGGLYPSMTVASLADKRQELIMKNLPFAIDLIGSAMRAGLDFSAAVRYYVSTEKKTNPLAVEFGVMLRQMELGKTRVEALEDVANRVQTDDFRSFSGAVAHGTEIGASIVDTMRVQGEEMRRARFNRAERKAARAPSIMILPIAVFIMPAIFVVIGTPVLIKIQSSGLGAMMQ
ncbi:MAG: type II secretion system F family protein [Victivallales bacterium]|nr:type II secretion system F family protein [Victivallales bacterium]